MYCEQELIEDATNIQRRLIAMDKMPGRTDIANRAADLIAWQDGAKFLSELGLTISEKALGRWIADIIGEPGSASEEALPPGCKLPPLFFSPAYQFHLALNRPSSSALAGFSHVPRTVREIESHLHEWMGSAFEHASAFENVSGVSIAAIAAFLASIRQSHPALFLLLLSEEVEHATRLVPALQWPNAPGQVAHWRATYFEKSRCSIAAIFRAMRMVRRVLRILCQLNADTAFDLTMVKHCARNAPAVRFDPSMRALLKRANLTVPVLRKIVLMDNDRHGDTNPGDGDYRFYQAESDPRTLARLRCLDGPDSVYTGQVLDDFMRQMEATLPVAGSPREEWPVSSVIEVDRIGGRGGTRYGHLGNFYGLLPTDLAAHVAIGFDRTLEGRSSNAALSGFANALLVASGYGRDGEGEPIRVEHIRRQAKLAAYVFPGKREFGHATGFADTSWQGLESDQGLWVHLVRERQSCDPIGLMFVQLREHLLRHTHDVKKLDRIDEAARIICHLAQCTGLLSGDPVWLRLQERTRAMLGVTLSGKSRSRDKVKSFGDGPKTLAALIAILGVKPDRVECADVIH